MKVFPIESFFSRRILSISQLLPAFKILKLFKGCGPYCSEIYFQKSTLQLIPLALLTSSFRNTKSLI